MIPRAKYTSQQNWGVFFTTAHRHKGNPTGTCVRWTSVRLYYPWTAHRIRISFFPHFVFTPFARIHKNKSQPRDLFPPLSFAIRQGSFPADVAKSVLIRFSPPPAAYRSGGPQRPLRACLYSYFYNMYLYKIYIIYVFVCVCVWVNILNAKYFLLW